MRQGTGLAIVRDKVHKQTANLFVRMCQPDHSTWVYEPWVHISHMIPKQHHSVTYHTQAAKLNQSLVSRPELWQLQPFP